MRHFIGWVGDKPVATSTLFTETGVAAISNVSTIPEARSQGIGSAVTLVPLLLARHAGLKQGALFSSKMAVPMYRRLGFKDVCTGHVFMFSGG